ncbi:MAG: MBL fold metallo-hydrolase [Chloroflexi bacterium]|nr:MBL fold metallo-hydrolase [Chloroflexota bacterium]
MPPLTLTVLGASPAAPNAGGACSGYLVRHGDTAVLMDCGSGVSGRVAQHIAPQQVSALAISHLHPDHYFDIVPLYYILRFGDPPPAARVPMYVPPDGTAFLRHLGQLISDKSEMLEDIFQVCDYPSGGSVQIGSLQVSFHPVQHYVQSHAMHIESADGATLVFSSDVGPCTSLVEAARGADVLLCESALVDPTHDEPHPERRGHMSAGEAGAAARQASVRRLVLTHYRSGPNYDDRHRQAAEAAFGGPVELAREGKTYTIG